MKLESVQYMLDHGDATLGETNNVGMTAWDLFIAHMRQVQRGATVVSSRDRETMMVLLRFMVLHGAPPPELITLLLPADRLVVGCNVRLRVCATTPVLSHAEAIPSGHSLFADTTAPGLGTHL
jgi:hypothetical protein